MKPLVDIWRREPSPDLTPFPFEVKGWGVIHVHQVTEKAHALSRFLIAALKHVEDLEQYAIVWSDEPLPDCPLFIMSATNAQSGGLYFPGASTKVEAWMRLANFLKSLDKDYLEQEFGITLEINHER